jgi:hypothetical protein
MRLPRADLAFMFDAMLARKSSCPSLERVTSESSSPFALEPAVWEELEEGA